MEKEFIEFLAKTHKNVSDLLEIEFKDEWILIGFSAFCNWKSPEKRYFSFYSKKRNLVLEISPEGHVAYSPNKEEKERIETILRRD